MDRCTDRIPCLSSRMEKDGVEKGDFCAKERKNLRKSLANEQSVCYTIHNTLRN